MVETRITVDAIAQANKHKKLADLSTTRESRSFVKR